MDCCKVNNKTRKCRRMENGKIFMLPRRFTRNRCVKGPVRGFTMRSSCAPYKYCKTKKYGGNKEFFFNPNNPNKAFDVYIDKDPTDTIPIKYSTVNDVINTIKKLERLYKSKKYSHKRIWQVGMIMKVRLEVMNKYKKTRYKKAKEVYKRYNISKRYFEFLGKRSKLNSFEDRSKMVFKF